MYDHQLTKKTKNITNSPESKQQSKNKSTSKVTVQKQAVQTGNLSPGLLTPSTILQLQRTIGNKATAQLLLETRAMRILHPVQREAVPGLVEMTPAGGAIQRQEGEEEENLQMKRDGSTINTPTLFQPPLQKKDDLVPEHRKNNTGMPDNLKTGIETLSGLNLSDVRVHRNSDKPPQVGALAYTQGTDIHIAPGQEQHLPHEAWHVVQQKQGRVQATTQAAGLPVNDEPVLEKEADVMGEKALQMKDLTDRTNLQHQNDISEDVAPASDIIQRTKWDWYDGQWHPRTPTSTQPPQKVGKYESDYYDDGIEEKEEKEEKKEKEETIDDLKKRCGSDPLSISTYNLGVSYARKEFGFMGELSHGKDKMHLHPKARLQEMCDAGATISQLKEVLKIWGK